MSYKKVTKKDLEELHREANSDAPSALGQIVDAPIDEVPPPKPALDNISDIEEYNSRCYKGDFIDPDDKPYKDSGFERIAFDDPALLAAVIDDHVAQERVRLYLWQIKTLEKFGQVKPTDMDPFRAAVCAANGSGKDRFIVALFCIWFCLTKIRSRCIVTSSSGTQLTAQTETYIADMARRANEKFGPIFKIRQRYISCRLTGSEIRLFATDEAGRAEGYHPLDPGAEMAIVVSEAKTVVEQIFDALRRCTGYNYWIEVSTPGEPVGHFYNFCTELESSGDPNDFFLRVTSYDCDRHLSPKDREKDKRDLGEHSALYRSKHLALFTSLGGATIIPQELIEKCLKARIPYIPSEEDHVGIDLAAGGDETVIIIRNGNRVKNMLHFRERDTTITADLIENFLKENHIDNESERIVADDGGVGHSIIDMLVRRDWNIRRMNNKWAPLRKNEFGNRGAENWYKMKRLVEEQFLIIPDDPILIKQLYTRRRKDNDAADGKLKLESKAEAIANGRPSPDRADAYILAYVDENIETMQEAIEAAAPPKPKGIPIQAFADYYRENVMYPKITDVPTGKPIHSSAQMALSE